MMTLEEAIIHCEEQAIRLGKCECAEEHLQLANWLKELQKFRIEYNTNTSAGHPMKDDDIVRYSLETRRVKDKEP